MNRLIAWFAENHVASNLLMALVLVGGLFALPRIKQEVFPELDLPAISVSVAYPGASPSEVEQAICVRIEEELQGIQGIRRLRSNAGENAGSVVVVLLAGEDVRKRLDEIRTRVDGIDTFPDEAEEPIVRQAEIRFQVLDVAVHGDVDEWTLKRLGQRARDEIAALPGVTHVELVAPPAPTRSPSRCRRTTCSATASASMGSPEPCSALRSICPVARSRQRAGKS